MADAGPSWAFSARHRIFAPSSSALSVSAIVLSVTLPPSNCCCKENEKKGVRVPVEKASVTLVPANTRARNENGGP